jgi:hypothetical protein
MSYYFAFTPTQIKAVQAKLDDKYRSITLRMEPQQLLGGKTMVNVSKVILRKILVAVNKNKYVDIHFASKQMKQIVSDFVGSGIEDIAIEGLTLANERDTDFKKHVDAVNAGDWETAKKFNPNKFNGNLGESILDTAATLLDITRLPDNIKAAIATSKYNKEIEAKNKAMFAAQKKERADNLKALALSEYQKGFPAELSAQDLKNYGMTDAQYLKMKADLWGMTVAEYKKKPPVLPQQGYGLKKKAHCNSLSNSSSTMTGSGIAIF